MDEVKRALRHLESKCGVNSCARGMRKKPCEVYLSTVSSPCLESHSAVDPNFPSVDGVSNLCARCLRDSQADFHL